MNLVKAANAEPIPGYRLIEPLGSGGFGEVWKCEAPGGLYKAIKFVRGETDAIHDDGPAGAEQELRALQRVKSLRHPFLLSLDRVEYVDGELVIVMELADRSLHDLLVEYQAAGKPGVPRAELLRYFAEAAEALDLLNLEHGLQHLDVKPRNLFLVGRHVKVADFGLVSSLAELSGNAPHAVQMGGVTPVYASPESFFGAITLFSDQYSLAITYVELLHNWAGPRSPARTSASWRCSTCRPSRTWAVCPTRIARWYALAALAKEPAVASPPAWRS